MKIISYNLNGLRAASKLNVLNWLKNENADILCLQEVRAEQSICEKILKDFNEYNIVYNCGKIKGYSGTITLSKIKPIKVVFGFGNEEDIEGRTITTFFSDFVVVNCYVPNGSKRLEYKKEFIRNLTVYVNSLLKSFKKIFICCDANIAHTELDVNKPKETSKKSGFLLEERVLINRLLENNFIDSFRELNPELIQYTWRSYRARKEKNDFGWRFRFDYIICSKNLKDRIKRCYSQLLEYSDHLPVILEVM